MSAPTLADIETCLPQTQCTRCGFDDCDAYARALLAGETRANRCPPGGDPGLRSLSTLLQQTVLPLAEDCGRYRARTRAVIREPECIGCTKCIQACPVDAIVGAARLMHTVITDECTGCELCLPPCPVDCIELVAAPQDTQQGDWPWPEVSRQQADRAVRRLHARKQRLAQLKRERDRKREKAATTDNDDRQQRIREGIRQAVARARARRRPPPTKKDDES